MKSNGFCGKDYQNSGINEVAQELKWEHRSQIHPTATNGHNMSQVNIFFLGHA